MFQYSSSEKKLVKLLANCFFGPNLHKKGVIMDHAQNEKQLLLAEITGTDQQIKLFILSKYHTLLLSYESFSILCDVFFQKRFIFS